MPLHDHFHPPSSDDLPWESFNTLWVASLVRWLNRTLPRDRFRAFAQIHLGPHVEADVAEFERPAGPPGNGAGQGTALLAAARPAAATIPAVFPDEVSVRVTETRNHLLLVGCLELVSPGNKKEQAERRAFAAKCMSYLHAGVGLVVVDVVTERRVNLHHELMQQMQVTDPAALAADPLYAVSYHPVRRDGRNEIDLWPAPLRVGGPQPVVPFALKGGPILDLDLEATYADALADSGL